MTCKNWREDSDSQSHEHEVCAHRGYVSCAGQRSNCIHLDNYRKEVKKAKVSLDLCVGCGLCEMDAPQNFKVVDGVSTVIKQAENKDEEYEVQIADGECPVSAITLEG